MAKILQEWLEKTLDKSVTWAPETFGAKMKDGLVVAEILLNYKVINDDEYAKMLTTNEPKDNKKNWLLLIVWLKKIDICLDAKQISEIDKGSGPSLLMLFYQLFLHFDEQDRTDFIKEERKMVSRIFEKIAVGFKMDREEKVKKKKPEKKNLIKSGLNIKDNIEWENKTGDRIKDSYDATREACGKIMTRNKGDTPRDIAQAPKLTDKEKQDMIEFTSKYPLKHYTYEQLVALENGPLLSSQISSSIWTENYLASLHKKYRKTTSIHRTSKVSPTIPSNASKLLPNLSSFDWNQSLAGEEGPTDLDITTKILKISEYEKGICARIVETKQKMRDEFKMRLERDTEFTENRAQQFSQHLDSVKEQVELDKQDIEKQKEQILHNKLYAERVERIRKCLYEMCHEILLRFMNEIFKIIFHSSNESLKDETSFNVVVSTPEMQVTENIETIVRLELDRREEYDENDFRQYHNYTSPWIIDYLVPNYDQSSTDRLYEKLGNTILGYVIYTLLELKYPFPPSRPSAGLPNYTAKAILRGINDRPTTEVIQALLNPRKILVVRLESAINYCLRQYKENMIGSTEVELSFDKLIITAPNEEMREKIRLLKHDDDITYRPKDIILNAMYGVIPPNAKSTQTPAFIPEDQICLSQAAELGKYAYEFLSIGENLTDHLISAMIVAYLKSQEHIDGFVLIDYPNNYQEAKVLEETFSGRVLPKDCYLEDNGDIFQLEESILKRPRGERDAFKSFRDTDLLEDPLLRGEPKLFQTYFTCYINLVPTDDIKYEEAVWDLNLENSQLIDRFYAAMGINYSMYYETISKPLIVQICKYIIGDFTMPLKSLEALFGERITSFLGDVTPGPEEKKSNRIRSSKLDSINARSGKFESSIAKLKDKSRHSKMSKIASLTHELEMIKSASADIFQVSEELVTIPMTIIEEEKVPPIAGEEKYEYGVIHLKEAIGLGLASLWQDLEFNYIGDLTQLFLDKKLQMLSLVPYNTYVQGRINEIKKIPSNKQDLVYLFQREYNDSGKAAGDPESAKKYWHCKVVELQIELSRICDEKKKLAIKERQSVLDDDWLMNELTIMANIFISCMQSELDRFLATYRILHEFYSSILHDGPSVDITNLNLNKISRNTEEITEISTEDEIYVKLKEEFQKKHNIDIHFSNHPSILVIEENVEVCINSIKDIYAFYKEFITNERTIIENTDLAFLSNVINVTIPTTTTSGTDDSALKENALKEDALKEGALKEEALKENALKCIDEWLMAVTGEMHRTVLRFLVLQSKCYDDMQYFFDHVIKIYMNINIDIDKYYLNEIKSVNRLCKYLHLSVENEKPIVDTIELVNDKFVTIPNFMHPDSLPSSARTRSIYEPIDEVSLALSHLLQLRSSFKTLAPQGIIPSSTFKYVLQDFIITGQEKGKKNDFPDIWRSIDPEKVSELVFSLYGDTPYIDWRDFLLQCLNLKYPDIIELLRMRKDLRCKDLESTELISETNFFDVELWFENDFSSESVYNEREKDEIHKFIFDLYETDDQMSYPQFLLACCKNVDPVLGFVNALSMAIGRNICYDVKECEEAVCQMVQIKKDRDAETALNLKYVDMFIDMLLTRVMDSCEGYFVTELEFVPVAVDKKDKKGRNVKTTARSPKKAKSTETRPVMSTKSIHSHNVKQPEKKTEVKRKISVMLSDPNKAYVVSQSVIWNVLRLTLPGYFTYLDDEQTHYGQQVADVLKLLEVDTDTGDIYVCKFISDPNMCLLFHKTRKFKHKNLNDEIRKICYK